MAAKKNRWSACNLLEPDGEGGNRLWQFALSTRKARLSGNLKIAEDEPIPAKAVAKDWRQLFKKKLNVSCLSPGAVFYRVVRLPQCEPEELAPMIEFQLEQLSPLPINQIVWSIEPVPHREGEDDGGRTVVAVITGRDAVEKHLGKLESGGFHADRIEAPFLRDILPSQPEADGVHLFLNEDGERFQCQMAWWAGGTLCDLNVLTLTANDTGRDTLLEKIRRIVWAGEMEGWIPPDLACRLTICGTLPAGWKGALEECFEGRLTGAEPLVDTDRATLTAERAVRSLAPAGLLPAEFALRYRQRFQDVLWMEGLKWVVALCLVGMLIYFAYGTHRNSELEDVQEMVANQGQVYTNALELRAMVETLQKQKSLKFAALDAWYKVTVGLPRELNFTRLTFSSSRTVEGKTLPKLTIAGSAAMGQHSTVNSYHNSLTRMELNGRPLFTGVEPGLLRNDERKKQLTWSLIGKVNGE